MATNPTNTKKQAIISQKDLNLLLRIIKNNWWVFFVVLPVFYGVGTFYVFILNSVYESQTTILLKTNDQYYQNNVLSDQNFYSYSSYVDNLNEQRIIQSYDLARQVVDKLIDKIQTSSYIVGKVRTTEQFKGTPFKITVNSLNPDYFEQIFDFKIIDFDNYELFFEKNGLKQSKKGKFGQDLVDLEMSLRIDREGFFIRERVSDFSTIFYQFIIHTPDYLISNIQNNLTVQNPEYTNILTIGLKDIIPERAILILDTLNNVYLTSKLKTKFELNDRTISYIDKQLDEITYSLKGIEDTMQNYKAKNSIIDLDWERGDFLSKIGEYDSKRSQMQLEINAISDLEKYIIEDKDPQFLPPNIFISEKSGFMTAAVADLYSKQIELNKAYNVAKEVNPLVADLKASIKKTKQDLLVYINNTRKATQQQIDNVNKEILAYISEAKLIPGKQRDMLTIQRKAAVSEQLYNFLLEKRANTKIAKASIVPDMKIVEAPRNIGIASPDKPAIQKSFLSFGLLLSIIIIIIRSFFLDKIKSVDHLKELTDLPLVGVLPFSKEENNTGLVVDYNPTGIISESFRSLRTNLLYANIGFDAKTYLVTSYLPSEGKTFTSCNLAAIFAKSGKKTVLIELDLHKPRIYKRFGLPAQTKGITTCLVGMDNYEDIISETYIKNLYCLFSGPVPPNPSEMVLSDKLKVIIDRAKQDFDIVIIDTPPAGILSDSIYLINQVDASIFVLNTKSSTKKVTDFLHNVIETNSIKNVLLLLNGVSRVRKRYYYNGYGYSYGYGYGYGYGNGYGYGGKDYGYGKDYK